MCVGQPVCYPAAGDALNRRVLDGSDDLGRPAPYTLQAVSPALLWICDAFILQGKCSAFTALLHACRDRGMVELQGHRSRSNLVQFSALVYSQHMRNSI